MGDESKLTRTTYTKVKPDEPHNRWYTEPQVRKMLARAHEARREAQLQLELYKTEITRLERYGFMLSRGALVPVGWVAVPVEPTEAMRSVIINESDVYQSPDALYAALLAAAPKLREKRQPLSDAQIADCAWGYFEDHHNLPDFAEPFVRAIEAAHNITGAPA